LRLNKAKAIIVATKEKAFFAKEVNQSTKKLENHVG